MKTSKSRKHDWYYHNAISKPDLHKLKNVITEVNGIAEKVENVASHSGGHHGIVNEKLKEYGEDLKFLFQSAITGKSNLKDLVSQSSPTALYYAGYKILSGKQTVPFLMLVEIDRAYGIDAVLNFVHGSHEAYRRFNPLVANLLSDGTSTRFVDATKTAGLSEGDGWRRYAFVEKVADIVTHMHYLTEKNGLYNLSLAAKAFGLSGVLKVFALKIYADHLHLYKPKQRFSQFHSDKSVSDLSKHYVFDNIPGHLLTLEDLPTATHRKLEQLIDHSIISGFDEVTMKRAEYGGALVHRSLGNIVSGCEGGSGPDDNRVPCPSELLEIEKRAPDIWDEAVALLSRKPMGRADKERPFLAVDIFDFESNSVQRKLLAAGECQKNWEMFISGCNLGETVYEKLLKEPPNCPMPYSADQPVGQRLKAAVTGQLMSDIGVGATAFYPLPAYIFAYKKDPSRGEERNKAMEKMHTEVSTMIQRLIAFHFLREATQNKIDDILDGWISFQEKNYRFAGVGVSSVETFIFPAFFFSDIRFHEMLAGEQDWYISPWLKIRKHLKDFGTCFEGRNWHGIHKIILEIFSEINKLSLITIDTIGILSSQDIFAAIQPPAVSPFSPPSAHFSKEQIAVPESLAPVQLITSAPGNASRYERIVKRNEQFIKKLRRIDSNILKPCTSFKRRAKTGPIFDDQRLPFWQEGELLYSMVQYKPKSVPGQKTQVVILFDFSGSMGQEKVAKAKDVAVIMAEGLKERFNIQLYLYTTNNTYYELIKTFDSEDRTAGKMGLASITANDTMEGRGWNPDAAMLLAVNGIMKGGAIKHQYILIHISDCEFCKSLNRSDLANGTEEVGLASKRIVDEGNSYVIARVGNKDEDPFQNSDIQHEYIYFPDGVLKDSKVDELYRILLKATKGMM